MPQRTIAIVQARMGSSRFPGKMLARLGRYPLLEWVLRRVGRAEKLSGVVLATSDLPRDDALVEVAAQCGVPVYRGSESDVLSRFAAAALQMHADTAVRICADNPFVDPDELDRLIEYFQTTPCDYACNHQDRLGSGYADGFGAEIFSADLLRHVNALATEARHREHVTLLLWECNTEYRLRAVPAPAGLAFPAMRFDIDIPEDLSRLNRLVQAGDINLDSTAFRIVECQSHANRVSGERG